MLITHPQIKKIVAESEKQIKTLTGNSTVKLMVMQQPAVTVTFEQIEEVVCDVLKVSQFNVYKRSRKRELVTARQLICYYAKIYCDMSLKSIGKKVGGKDHTTVIHSIRRIKELLDSGDEIIYYDLERINKRLKRLFGKDKAKTDNARTTGV